MLNLAFLALGDKGYEEVCVIVVLPGEHIWSILLEHILVEVAFVYRQQSLGQRAVLEGPTQVECIATQNFIGWKEVSVVGLDRQVVVFARVRNLVQQAVVEGRLAILTTEMCVSLKRILRRVEEATEVHVEGVFVFISRNNILTVEDANTHFKSFWRLLADVPKSSLLFRGALTIIDLDPHFEDTLSNSRAGVMERSILNGLVSNSHPLG